MKRIIIIIRKRVKYQAFGLIPVFQAAFIYPYEQA